MKRMEPADTRIAERVYHVTGSPFEIGYTMARDGGENQQDCIADIDFHMDL